MFFECIFHCKRLKYTWSTNPKSNKAIFYIKMEKYILLGCALWHSGKIMHAWHAYYYTALKHIVDLIMIIIIDFLKSSNNPNVLVCYLYQLGSMYTIDTQFFMDEKMYQKINWKLNRRREKRARFFSLFFAHSFPKLHYIIQPCVSIKIL